MKRFSELALKLVSTTKGTCHMHTLSRRNALRLLALSATGVAAASVSSVAADAAPLAINGYDPVAYFTVGKPTPGSAKFEYEYDHRLYRFSSAGDRDRFIAEPAHYAPQYQGQCALDLADGKVSPIVPDAWLIRDDKLYLFGAPQGPALFQANFPDNVSKADQNRKLIPIHQ
jgi:YHS domain-containing protein